MGRKSEILSEISYLEGRIVEYNNCIDDLRRIESSAKNKLLRFDIEVSDKIKMFSTSSNGFWQGKAADDVEMQKEYHCADLKNLSDDVDYLIQDIILAIYRYDNNIIDCQHRINSLRSELDAILEAERRATEQYIL